MNNGSPLKAKVLHGLQQSWPEPTLHDSRGLWNACNEYFQWAEAKPLRKQSLRNRRKATVKQLLKMCVMTVSGLVIFLDTRRSTWDDYRVKKGFS
ncbi:terminase small subunit [Rhizobium sp. No.120]